MHIAHLLPLLTLLSFSSPTHARPRDAIPLSQIRTLTLHSPSKTTSRRLPPIPQLKCISPAPICALHPVDTMRCTNQGSSYSPSDVEWSCTASLPPELRLGSTDVLCEGYDGPEDELVLKGSCGVEYRLVLTREGEERYPELVGKGQGWDLWSGGFMVLFFAVLGWILYSAWSAATDRPRAGQRGGGGGGGWGGGGGGGGGFWPGDGGWGPGNDPPPPYPGHKPEEQWRPGFWTGLMGGAGAAYLAGQRGRQGGRREGDWLGGRRYGGYGGNGGFGGYGERDEGPRRRGGDSGPRYESTGFGSTSRR